MKLINKSISAFQGMMRKSIGFLTGTTYGDVLQEEGTISGRNLRPNRPYSQIVPFYASVKLIAESFAGQEVRVSDGDDNILEDCPAVKLLEQPNPGQTGTQLRYYYAACMAIFNRCYFYTPDAPKNKSTPVTEVYVINPIQLDPQLDANGDLQFWRYLAKPGHGGYIDIQPEEIHEVYRPDFEQYDQPGISIDPRKVAAQALAQHFKSDLANEGSLDNGVEPGGLFTTSNAMELSDAQRKDFHRQIREKHQGVSNRRRYMLLEGGLTFEPTSANFRDMEFSELKKMSREDICIALGVNPLLLGYTSGQQGIGSGQELEAHERRFWVNTITPLCTLFSEEWDMFITSRVAMDRSLTRRKAITGGKIRKHAKCYAPYVKAKASARVNDRKIFTWYDLSSVPALMQVMLDKAEQALKLTEAGVPLNHIYQAFNMPFEEVSWGDTWFKPVGKTDVQAEDALANEPDGTPAPGSSDPESQDSQNEIEDVDLPDDATGEDEQTKQIRRLITKALSENHRRKLWEQWRRSWSGLQKTCESKIRKHFMDLRSEVLANLKTNTNKSVGANGIVTKDQIGTLLFDLVKANSNLIVKMHPLIVASFELGGKQVMDEAAVVTSQAANVFAMDDPAVVAAIRKREIAITTINRTMQKRLRKVIADSVATGEQTAEQIAEHIRKQFNIATGTHARTIAYTEIGGAVEESRNVAYEQADIPLKSWLWSRAETGRRNHASTEAATMDKPVPVKADFTISGSGVPTPHPRGSGVASEDVNCGCSTIARYDDPKKDLKLLVHLHTKGFTRYQQNTVRKDVA